ncbi:MAG: VTT domain-containing protein [Acidobacteria bacterium]|nr:VTT domain-containing protein [Acidobacteriota bacterium]
MRKLLAALLAYAWGTSFFAWVRKLGSLGLFLLGILDSSFLFLPFGNDLLLIALVSSQRTSKIWILYVLSAALGSLVGVFFVDLMARKMGEQGLEKFVKANKIKRLKAKMEKNAGRVIFVATLMPPPFPFTAAVMTASALQTPRKVVFTAIVFGRLVRFTVEAILALYFGRQVHRFLESDVMNYVVYGFITIAVIGSIISIRKWLGSQQKSVAA